MNKRYSISLALAAAFAILTQGNAGAQVNQNGFSLPLTLAVKAATTAIATCASSGYRVSAAVVDMSGTVLLEAKGDRSTIHTTATAERKAYTVITFGPIFQFDASSAFADLVAKNPSGATLAATPGVAALPGAVAIKAGNQIIAALGVSGSPGGDKDEACAQTGVAGIQGDITSALSRGTK
jgi:uncharacterized protein GlcG (DUF336 family)